MTVRRLFCLGLAAFAIGCGFGLADDTGKPIPGPYWPWICADGSTPDGDAGCPPIDAGADSATPADGAAEH
jgi:hypothetical protein